MKQRNNQTVIYDDNCFICRSMTAKARKILFGKKIEFLPSREYEANSGSQYIDRATLDKSIVYISDGKVHTGSDAVAGIIKQLSGGWKILGYIISIPGIKQLFDLFYKAFARYRHFLSRLVIGSPPRRDP